MPIWPKDLEKVSLHVFNISLFLDYFCGILQKALKAVINTIINLINFNLLARVQKSLKNKHIRNILDASL